MSVHGSGSPNGPSGTVAAAAEPAEKPKGATPSQATPARAAGVTKPIPHKVSPGSAREATKARLLPVPPLDPGLKSAIKSMYFRVELSNDENIRYPLAADEKPKSQENAASLFRDVSYALKFKTGGDRGYAAIERAADELVAGYYAKYGDNPRGLKPIEISQGGINLRAACDYALEMFALYPASAGNDKEAERNFSNLIAWIKPHANEGGYDPGHDAFERLDRATQGRPAQEVTRIFARLWEERVQGHFPIPKDIPPSRIKELDQRFGAAPQDAPTGPRTPAQVVQKQTEFKNLWKAASLISAYRGNPPTPKN